MTTRLPETALSAQALQDLYAEIRHVYLNYPHPWVIGYSGGKDSTTALQLIWYALSELPAEQRTKTVHVISTDTRVETPVIVDYIDHTLERIGQAAQDQRMPFKVHKLMPEEQDSFWVNLIGRGYPAPNSIFRWCTDRLKINPSNRFILREVASHGEVILILGIRQGESMTRDQVINMHRVRGQQLARHGQLAGAWVYMPIERFTVDDVWTYLLQMPSPWGGDNRSLSSLYRSAQSGECPLVVDKTTPSCGNSRFGCWTCTVVTRDKSMEAMIDNGEEWMVPLLEFRDWLASTQDPAIKPDTREYRGRNGRIKISRDGQLRYRTYTLAFSKEMLRRLLKTQVEVWQHNPDFHLISEGELKEIRRLWLEERQDWQDELPGIYRQTTGRTIDWDYDFTHRPSQLEANILNEVAQNAAVPARLLQKLLDAERQHLGMRRRSAIHTSVDRILREDWRSLEDVQREAERQRLQAEQERTPA